MAFFTINVEPLHEGPIELEVNIQPLGLDLVDEDFKFTGPVTGRVVFQMVSNEVLAHGELQARAETACVRCLEKAEVELKVPVDEIWIKNRPEEQMDQEFNAEAPLERSYTGDEIELDEAFRELILSELPDRPLCREDCKGLCPGCGVNLNEEPCHCPPKAHEEEEAPEGKPEPDWKKALKNIRLES